MHLLLPLSKRDREDFRLGAVAMGFDEFVMHKFLYTLQDVDVDAFQIMHDDRISLLIYGWEICEIHLQNYQNARNESQTECALNESVKIVIKWLVRFSVDLWLSKEFDGCEYQMRKGLVYCLRRAEEILLRIPELSLMSWNNILKWDIHPWNNKYVSRFFNMSRKIREPKQKSIEDIEQSACKMDIDYLREENVFIILMRLMKLLDGYNLEGAKQLSMRVLAAWNAIFERAKDIPGNEIPQVPNEFKRCIVSICHIYLMVIYEMDTNRGFLIDNMMNNIRFYHRSFLGTNFEKPLATIVGCLNFTPARFIALTCINLNISMHKFFEIFTNQAKERNFSTFFGILSQTYISYILGNQLMEMNNMNEEHFNANIERYKVILNAYLEEREISELFLRDQLKKQELQHNSNNITSTMKNFTNIEDKFCKGNRSYNIGSWEKNVEDDSSSIGMESEIGSHRKIDTIFENMPNNEEILNYAYRMLALRNYNGWYFAKIVLLLKIIGHEVNVIETWRYHPGLTTDFMLSIETKLSKRYEDLALIFHEHFFLEKEFWLTAFYLNPVRKYYNSLLRCGMRLHRRVQHSYEEGDKNIGNELNEKGGAYAKYGLLSSTIDVTEILKIRNHETPNSDYDEINKSLLGLKLSLKTVKDLISATFLPRNKSFSWALDWSELRKRCKQLLKYPEWKRRLVELNMAEANDRLKFLNVDYDKYKNRPQLDYGTIEEGYESVMHFAEREQSNEDSNDDFYVEDDIEEADFSSDQEDYEEMRGKEKRCLDGVKKNSQDFNEQDVFSTCGTRRTRSRTAAAMATAILSDEVDRCRKDAPLPKANNTPELEKSSETSLRSNHIISSDELSCDDNSSSVIKRNLQDILQERSIYHNETFGFGSFPDIWDFDANILQDIEIKSTIPMDDERLYKKLADIKATTGIFEKLDEEIMKASNDSSVNSVQLHKITSQANAGLNQYSRVHADHKNNEVSSEILINQCHSQREINEQFLGSYSAPINVSCNSTVGHAIARDYILMKDDTENTVNLNFKNSQLTAAQSEENFTTSREINTGSLPYVTIETGKTLDVKKHNKKFDQEDPQRSFQTRRIEETENTIKHEKKSKFRQDTSSLATLRAENDFKEDPRFTNNTENGDCVARFESSLNKNQYTHFQKIHTSTEKLNSDEQINDNIVKGGELEASQLIDILMKEKDLQDDKDQIADITLHQSTNSTKSHTGIFPPKQLVIRLHRLKVTDCQRLRQPRVLINRFRTNTLSTQSSDESLDKEKCSEDRLKSTEMLSSNTLQLRPFRRRKFLCNYSPSSSASDEEFMGPASKRIQMKSNAVAKRNSLDNTSNMVVTPRSDSGLKMLISSAPSGSTCELPMAFSCDNIELIHISSSSSSSSLEIMDSSDDEIHPLAFVRPIIEDDVLDSNPLEDPLYEEEIILCD